MATQAELLSRGQASRNRHWAGVRSRGQVAAIVFLLCAVFGGVVGWAVSPQDDRDLAGLYARAEWHDVLDPFSRNLQTSEAGAGRGARAQPRRAYPASPIVRAIQGP